MQETLVQFLHQADPLEEGQATHSSILGLLLWLSWQRIHLQSGRSGFDPWIGKIPWKRERLPTPALWPGEFHGLYSPCSHRELDTTEQPLTFTVSTVSPSICHWVMGPDAMILAFWMLSFKPAFSLYFFTFIKRLFTSSLLSAIRVVSSAYLRLLIFLLVISFQLVLHSAWHFTWCTLNIC